MFSKQLNDETTRAGPDDEGADIGDTINDLAVDPAAFSKLKGARLKAFFRWVYQTGNGALQQCYLLVRCNGPIRRLLYFLFKCEGAAGIASLGSPDKLRTKM